MKTVALGLVTVAALGASLTATPALAASNPANAAKASSTVATGLSPHANTPSATGGSRVAKPRPVSTRRLIIRAVNKEVGVNGVPSSQFTVERLRVSRSTWAAAKIVPERSADLDPADVLVRRTKGTWKVIDLGTAEVGCGVAPAPVLATLGLRC